MISLSLDLFFDISDVRRTEFVVSSVLRPSHNGNEWNERELSSAAAAAELPEERCL